jgi:hypothetical protein
MLWNFVPALPGHWPTGGRSSAETPGFFAQPPIAAPGRRHRMPYRMVVIKRGFFVLRFLIE